MSRLSRAQQRKFALAQTIGKERVKHWAVLPKCTGCPLLIGTRTGDMRISCIQVIPGESQFIPTTRYYSCLTESGLGLLKAG